MNKSFSLSQDSSQSFVFEAMAISELLQRGTWHSPSVNAGCCTLSLQLPLFSGNLGCIWGKVWRNGNAISFFNVLPCCSVPVARRYPFAVLCMCIFIKVSDISIPLQTSCCTGELGSLLLTVAFVFLLLAGYVFSFHVVSLNQRVGHLITSDPFQTVLIAPVYFQCCQIKWFYNYICSEAVSGMLITLIIGGNSRGIFSKCYFCYQFLYKSRKYCLQSN